MLFVEIEPFVARIPMIIAFELAAPIGLIVGPAIALSFVAGVEGLAILW